MPRFWSKQKIAVFSYAALFCLSASAAGAEEPQVVELRREVRPLPGALDDIPVFNSNCPEVVLGEGILLSTYPGSMGSSHLDYQFDGRFDVFIHHIADAKKSGRSEDLYIGLLVGNESDKSAKITTLDAASYLSQPDAPFKPLPPLVENDDGLVYAGPGDRVTDEILRGKTAGDWKKKLTVPRHQEKLLKCLPIPVSLLKPQLNGRSWMMSLKSNRPVSLALVSRFAVDEGEGKFRPPTEEEFIETLKAGKLVEPRETAPTPPDEKTGAFRYGRVSGVSKGSNWFATLTDEALPYLALPAPDKPVSYPIASLARGTFGTGQIQSAPLAVRNSDTAYAANGNYGVRYVLNCPVKNTTDSPLNLDISLETPIKSDAKKETLNFANYPQVFFRGTVKASIDAVKRKKRDTRPHQSAESISWNSGKAISHYLHIVEHRGEISPPLMTLKIPPSEERHVEIELLYPPDATPPQVLTFSTAKDVECTEHGNSDLSQ